MAPFYPNPSYDFYIDSGNSANSIKVDEPKSAIDPMEYMQEVLSAVETLHEAYGDLKEARALLGNSRDQALADETLTFYEDVIERYNEFIADLITHNRPS